MITHFRTALILLAAFTLLTGVVYPAMVTGIAQVFFPHQANGSLIVIDGAVAGSELIGQPFDAPWYFWGRPSATAPFPYNAAASAGSNLGPLNPALERAVRLRMEALRRAGSQSAALQDAGMENVSLVPVDLVTASASGLDPHISVAAARYQIPRVARARGVAEAGIAALVAQHTQGRQLGFLGEPRVNVLALNLALDAAYPLISWDKIR